MNLIHKISNSYKRTSQEACCRAKLEMYAGRSGIVSNSIKLLTIYFFFFSISCGTLGGFESRVFPVKKSILSSAFDSLYLKNSQYLIPEKWIKYNDWAERGYDF